MTPDDIDSHLREHDTRTGTNGATLAEMWHWHSPEINIGGDRIHRHLAVEKCRTLGTHWSSVIPIQEELPVS
jgi:hypothetical protein